MVALPGARKGKVVGGRRPLPRRIPPLFFEGQRKQMIVPTNAPPLTPQNRITLRVFVLLLLLLFLGTTKMVAPYLLAVLMGTILSVLFRSPYHYLKNRTGRPKLASSLVTAGICLVIIVPVFLFALLAVEQGIELAKSLQKHQDLSLQGISERLTLWKPLNTILGNATAIEQQLKTGVKQLASAAPGALFALFGGLPEFVLQLVLGLASCYFLLVDSGRFLLWLRDKIPLDPEVRGTIFNTFKDTSVSTIVATVSAAGVQTLIIVLGFLILGVPVPFLAGGLTFVLAWVPIIGSTPVWAGAAIYLFANGHTTSGFLMLGIGVLTGISDNIVHPMVLKGRGQMHPLVALVAIFGGISMFGVFGVFIGPIIASLLISMMNVWPMVAERYQVINTSSSTLKTSSEIVQ